MKRNLLIPFVFFALTLAPAQSTNGSYNLVRLNKLNVSSAAVSKPNSSCIGNEFFHLLFCYYSTVNHSTTFLAFCWVIFACPFAIY